jgi:penicillin-binding protein 1B
MMKETFSRRGAAPSGRRRARVSLYEGPRETIAVRVVRKALRAMSAAIVLAVIGFSALVAYYHWYYSRVVDARLAAGYLSSRAGIYAAPRVLRAGQKLSPERLASILRRAGYVDAGAAGRVWNGRFSVAEDAVIIEPAADGASLPALAPAAGSTLNSDAGPAPDAWRPRHVRVTFDGDGRIAEVAGDGAALDSYTLEPEPLSDETELRSAGREALTYDDLPSVLVRAVLATEDRRFYEHHGVDLWAVARAALSWGNAGRDELRQGGSTVTQQLVKNTYLTPERTLRRKFHEAVLAGVIESRLSKEEILALYCNEIYLGRRGGVAVRGVREAARAFFGKSLKDLSLAEAATLAGMIRSPARYAPDRHAEESRARRNTVLASMAAQGTITREQAEVAASEPLVVAPPERRSAVAPYFVDYVNRTMDERGAGARGGRIYTTIDLDLQRAAEEAVERQLARLGETLKGKRRPQAALVALEPRTGRVLAMVGGGSYAESQLNRATDARRQPGSVFKPVVYATALETGLSPLTVSLDAPREFRYDGRASYRPANYGGGYTMSEVTLREALVRSLNVVTVDVALRTGLSRVAAQAEALGLPRPESYPSLALGVMETTPLEIASAYTAFAAGGRVARPTPLVRIEGDEAFGLPEFPISEQVLKPSTSYMLTDMLKAVTERGTARGARGRVGGVAIAGKTGTSRDGWFAGYTPNLVCVVWVGFDNGDELGLTGADSALPIWTEFVRRATELRPELGGEHFERPESVSIIEIDPETGGRAHGSCPRSERVALVPAYMPAYECPLHGAALPMTMTASAEPLPSSLPPPATAVVASAAKVSVAEAASASHATRAASLAQPAAVESSAPIRATRVEVGSDGRTRLTNDLRPATPDERRR